MTKNHVSGTPMPFPFSDSTNVSLCGPHGRWIDNLQISSCSPETTISGHLTPKNPSYKALQRAAEVVMDLDYLLFAVAKLYRRVTAQSASELFGVMQTHAIFQQAAKLAEGGSALPDEETLPLTHAVPGVPSPSRL